jgi:hypothetical protein
VPGARPDVDRPVPAGAARGGQLSGGHVEAPAVECDARPHQPRVEGRDRPAGRLQLDGCRAGRAQQARRPLPRLPPSLQRGEAGEGPPWSSPLPTEEPRGVVRSAARHFGVPVHQGGVREHQPRLGEVGVHATTRELLGRRRRRALRLLDEPHRQQQLRAIEEQGRDLGVHVEVASLRAVVLLHRLRHRAAAREDEPEVVLDARPQERRPDRVAGAGRLLQVPFGRSERAAIRVQDRSVAQGPRQPQWSADRRSTGSARRYARSASSFRPLRWRTSARCDQRRAASGPRRWGAARADSRSARLVSPRAASTNDSVMRASAARRVRPAASATRRDRSMWRNASAELFSSMAAIARARSATVSASRSCTSRARRAATAAACRPASGARWTTTSDSSAAVNAVLGGATAATAPTRAASRSARRRPRRRVGRGA